MYLFHVLVPNILPHHGTKRPLSYLFTKPLITTVFLHLYDLNSLLHLFSPA